MARFDKAEEYIICEPLGHGRCGGRLARADDEGGRRVLRVLPGWERGDDRIWHEPPNDFARRQRGFRARPLPARSVIAIADVPPRPVAVPLPRLSGSLVDRPEAVRPSPCQRGEHRDGAAFLEHVGPDIVRRS